MSAATSARHPDDGALVRILDGQPLPDDDVRHPETCAACRARLAALERRGQAISALLDRADDTLPGPPTGLLERARRRTSGPPRQHAGDSRRWSRRPLLRAAAIALLLVSPLAAEPVRDWVGRTVARIATAIGFGEAPVPSDTATDIAITPEGDRVVIRVDGFEAGGRVSVRFEQRDDAVGRLPPPGAASLVALPDGFRIVNSGAAGNHYRFTLPAGTTVELRTAGSEPRTTAGGPGETHTFRLDAPSDPDR